MQAETILCGAAALGAAALLGGAYWAYRAAFGVDRGHIPPPRTLPRGLKTEAEQQAYRAAVEQLLSAQGERITARSSDGLVLSARYYAGEERKPLVLFFHGYRSSAARDGCGAFCLWRSRGCGVVLIDERGHGESAGGTTTLGLREHEDCLIWVDEVRRRFGAERELILMGVSMGATSVLLAAGTELPPQVRGIIADCGFTSPAAALDEAMRRRHYPRRLFWPMLALGARIYGRGLDVHGCPVTEALGRAKVPVLLIHGEADPIVPCAMVQELRSACAAPTMLLTVPGAGHGSSIFTDPARYAAAVDEFCRSLPLKKA